MVSDGCHVLPWNSANATRKAATTDRDAHAVQRDADEHDHPVELVLQCKSEHEESGEQNRQYVAGSGS
jgi:hypothetical protein